MLRASCIAVAAIAILIIGFAAMAADPVPAVRGKRVYAERCAACHGATLKGSQIAPPLDGTNFRLVWTTKPVSVLARRVRTTMPMDAPGTLSKAQTDDIVYHILKANRLAVTKDGRIAKAR